MRFERELFVGIVPGIQLDGNFVKLRGRNLINWLLGVGSTQTEKSKLHQSTDSAHLALVLIMTAISNIRIRSAVSLPADKAHPILAQSGIAGMIENMRVR